MPPPSQHGLPQDPDDLTSSSVHNRPPPKRFTTTIAEIAQVSKALEDLGDDAVAKEQTLHYEIKASGVMWSEDGTGFRDRGRKKELLVIQDEHARLKLRHRLVDGPADEAAVYGYLKAAFSEHGAPLVLKHDGGSIFHARRIRQLLAGHQVTELTGPEGYPQYNGKQERAMRHHGVRGRLRDRLEAAVCDLNDERPRPVLGGRTVREAYEQDRVQLPDRQTFIAAVSRKESELRAVARSRSELENSRRGAIEQVLLRYGLMRQWCDVSHNSRAEKVTNKLVDTALSEGDPHTRRDVYRSLIQKIVVYPDKVMIEGNPPGFLPEELSESSIVVETVRNSPDSSTCRCP